MSKPRKYAKKLSEYATLYNCTVRTITRYKAQGFPLDDEKKMREILGAQKHQPTGKDDAPTEFDGTEDSKLPISEIKRRRELVTWQKLAFQLDVERGKYRKNEEIIEDGYALGAAVGAALDILEANLPSACLGLSEVEMAAVIKSETRKIRALLADRTSGVHKAGKRRKNGAAA